MWQNPLAMLLPGPFAVISPELRLLGWTLVLALLVGGGFLLILWARTWRHRLNEQEPVEEPTLADYRKLFDAGLLDPHEFERIRAHLEGPATPPELQHGIQDPQLRTGIRRPPSADPPPAVPPTSDPTP
jgi:hypothetical protein